MDEALITQLVTALIALIMAIVAIMQNKQKNDIVTVMTAPNIVPKVQQDAVLSTLPARSYLMLDSTKKWITDGENDTDKKSILDQVAAAEANKEIDYTIHYSKGYYEINYGLIKSSGREK